MCRHFSRRMAAAIALVVALAAPTLFAQSVQLRATIPFDFYIADQLFPAGAYAIVPQARGDVITLLDPKGHTSFFMSKTQTKNGAINNSRLVFHRYGNTSVLASIYWEGYRQGRDVPSKMEKQLAQNSGVSSVAVYLEKK